MLTHTARFFRFPFAIWHALLQKEHTAFNHCLDVYHCLDMTKLAENPLFHVSLGDRDEWVVEAEWPDGTLERVSTFKNHSAAAHWIATASESWLYLSKSSTSSRS
jgi:hypothetical protein